MAEAARLKRKGFVQTLRVLSDKCQDVATIRDDSGGWIPNYGPFCEKTSVGKVSPRSWDMCLQCDALEMFYAGGGEWGDVSGRLTVPSCVWGRWGHRPRLFNPLEMAFLRYSI